MFKKYLLSSLFALSLSLPAFAEKKIIILPFEVSTKSTDIKAFSVGIMDILAQTLSVNDDFIILDRGMMQSELREKNILKTINLNKVESVKKAFDTDLIIKGKIQDYKNSYILSFSTIDSKTSKQIFTSQIIGNNIFDLQNKLALEIISQEKVVLNDSQRKRISLITKGTENISAYSNYVKGMSYYYLSTPESYKEAVKYFDKSISFDKNYTIALAEKAETLALMALYTKFDDNIDYSLVNQSEKITNSNSDELSSLHKARSLIQYIKANTKQSLEDAKKALELNPNDSEANYLFWINQEKDDNTLKADAEELEQIIKNNPYFSLSYIHRAILNFKNGKSDLSIADYQKVLSFIPENTFVYTKLGEINLSLNKNAEAQKNYESALAINQDNFQANLGLGQVYQAKDDIKQAIVYYNKSLKIKPDSAYPHFLMAISYHSVSKISKAIEEYQKAVEISPKDARYHSGLGQIYYQQNKLDDAISEYKLALVINKDLAYAHVNLGLAYSKQGKYQEAVDEIKEALKIKNDYVYAYYNLGVVYQEQGKNDDALNAYKDALNRDENYALAHNRLGMIYHEQGYIEESIEEITKAIKLEPTYANAYYNLGKIHRSQGKYNEAIQAYKFALKLKPQYRLAIDDLSSTYETLAIDLYNKNKVKEAIINYKEAIKVKPDNDSAYNNLGTAYFKLGKTKEALLEFKKAVFANPKNADSHDNLGLAYEKSGKKSEAIKEYKKACELGKEVSCKYAK